MAAVIAGRAFQKSDRARLNNSNAIKAAHAALAIRPSPCVLAGMADATQHRNVTLIFSTNGLSYIGVSRFVDEPKPS